MELSAFFPCSTPRKPVAKMKPHKGGDWTVLPLKN